MQMLCRLMTVWDLWERRKSHIPRRIKLAFPLFFSPSSPWTAAFPSHSLQREPIPSRFRWPLEMPLSRTRKISQFMVSSKKCPVMAPPACPIPSTHLSGNYWLLWKFPRPWENYVGPREVSTPSSYLVPEQGTGRHMFSAIYPYHNLMVSLDRNLS